MISPSPGKAYERCLRCGLTLEETRTIAVAPPSAYACLGLGHAFDDGTTFRTEVDS